MAQKPLESTPSIHFSNPPAPLFATGDQEKVELFGALSLLTLTDLREIEVFDPLEDRREVGIYEDDPDANASDQLKDLQFVRMQMDTEEPEVLLKRLNYMFDSLEHDKAIFLGLLEMEANAFERSVHLEIDQKIIDKIVAIHKHFRDETKFPEVKKRGFRHKYVRVIFKGADVASFYPVQDDWKLGDLANHLNRLEGFIAGIVVGGPKGRAEFYVLANSLRPIGIPEDQVRVDWVTLKQLLAEIMSKQKVPISWFRLDVGLPALNAIYGYDAVKDNPAHLQRLAKYNERVATMLEKKYFKKKYIKAQLEDGQAYEIDELSREEIKKQCMDLLETLDVLTQMMVDMDQESPE